MNIDKIEKFLTDNVDLPSFMAIMHNVHGSKFKDLLESNDLKDELIDLGYMSHTEDVG